jgi:ribA/ribD-fused uncharacterized protein
MKEIKGFFGEYRWLSNFWPTDIVFDGAMYKTVEHAYQAAKIADPMARDIVRFAETPKKAKALSYKISMRDGWDYIKLGIMELLVERKFKNNPNLLQKLLDTNDAYLEETNTWGDTFWGVCDGIGENNLGKILMKIREK